MKIKAKLNKPYNEKQRVDFIVQYNHQLGYEIRETETALEAWGYTEEEKQQKERERIANLSLTRGDVFRGLLLAKQVTRADIRSLIELMPEDTPQQKMEKEYALIDFDESLNFYRGVALIDTLGEELGISSEAMTHFFETNDYHYLIPDVRNQESNEEEPEEEPQEPEE